MRKVLYIFGALTDADVETLVRIGTRRRLDDGEVVIREGEWADSVILLLNGEFLVTKQGMGQIALLGAGEIVGEMSLVDSELPSATITARGRCLALFINKAILLQKLETNVGFGCRFYRAMAIFLADRLRATMQAPALSESSMADEAPVLADELDSGILDAVSNAGERFQRVLRLLTGQAQ
ncbi:MAG TPA: cyclic nucleotide-binding domain-containing protein [Xanthobacteraceae bacterium]|jgi:CRP-like cAMP-binding protein